MKKLLLITLMLALGLTGFSQTYDKDWKYDGDPNDPVNWNNALNWKPVGVPAATDDVRLLVWADPWFFPVIDAQTDAVAKSIRIHGGPQNCIVNGTLTIYGDLKVRSDAIFTVEAGATVHYTGDIHLDNIVGPNHTYSPNLIVNGTMEYIPTSIIVTSNADNGPNTLRQAVEVIADGGTITFDLPDNQEDIYLTGSEIEINKSLTIDGSNTAGNAVPVSVYGDGNQRIFHIPNTASGKTIEFNNMEINEGNATAAPGGGGILCEAGTLIVDNVSFNRNDASGTDADGGGIYAVNSTCTITNSTFDENYSNNGEGGGMYALDSPITLTGCTFSNNEAHENGGGIYTWSNDNTHILTIINSTFSNNNVVIGVPNFGFGGGIYAHSPINIKFTTVSENAVLRKGGGLYVSGHPTTIQNCLLGNNTAGIAGDDFSKYNSNVTDNGYNIVEDYDEHDFSVDTNNITGEQANLFGAALPTQNLADNGGPTQTLAIVYGSVAYSAGKADAAVTTDQRDEVRLDPPTIGAFEYIAQTIVVTDNADSGPNTLRQAVLDIADDGTITFDLPAGQEDIYLTGSEIEINKLLTIDGSNAGNPDSVSVYGDGTQRIFHITTAASGKTIEFKNMEINEGSATAPGGAGILCEAGTLIVDNVYFFQNDATVTDAHGGAIYVINSTCNITNSTFDENFSDVNGGGMYAHSSTCTITNSTFKTNSNDNGEGGGMYALDSRLTLTGCTFSNNEAHQNGGGIFTKSSIANDTSHTVTIINSTFAENNVVDNNTHTGFGGGIYAKSPINMKFTTVSANTVLHDGGGVYVDVNTLTIQNCMLGDNDAGGVGDDYSNYNAPMQDHGYNIVEDSPNQSWTAPGDITGQQDDLFGTGVTSQTLADNGGPTQTLAIEAGSVAFGAGIADAAVTVDQRDTVRQDSPTIGAFEYITNTIVVTSNANDGRFTLRWAIEHIADGGTITFDLPAGSEQIKTDSPLTIEKGITIDGANAGNPDSVEVWQDGGTHRIFHITTAASGKTIEFNNMQIKKGHGTAPGGAGILCEAGTLIVDNVIFFENEASGTDAHGGGIYVKNSTSHITNSTFDGNTSNNNGGGMYAHSSTCTITNSTFKTNSNANGDGGGMYAENTVVTLTGCTFNTNEAKNNGGGIYTLSNDKSHTLTIINSTFAENNVVDNGPHSGFGGGIYAQSPINMKFTTVSGNTVLHNGGGIFLDQNELTSQNCMLGDNSAGGGNTIGDDFGQYGGSVSDNSGHNIVEDSYPHNWNKPGDITGQQANLFGVGLTSQTLADNGGPTQTLAIVWGSVAIGAGKADAAVTTDQRDEVRQDPPTIGAYEYYPQIIVVTDNGDSGPNTLRQAVLDIHNEGTITFNLPAGEEDIILTGSEIEINKLLTIDGSNTAGSGVPVSVLRVGIQSRIFHIPNTASGKTIEFNNMKIKSGTGIAPGGGGILCEAGTLIVDSVYFSFNDASGTDADGGGIYAVNSTCTITNSTFDENYSNNGEGGGMYALNTVVTITGCTFSNNEAHRNGGGIFTLSDSKTHTLTIINSTFAENDVVDDGVGNGYGGGIYAQAPINMKFTTVSANTVLHEGGGVYINVNTLTIQNCMLGDNTAGGDGDDFSASSVYVVDDGHNIVEDSHNHNWDGGTNITGQQANLFGFGHESQTLADNGGPTQTLAIEDGGSVAYSAGIADPAVTTDQRDTIRQDPPTIGAYEYIAQTIVVTDNADAGPNTLRQAVLDIHDGGTITFNLPTGEEDIFLTGSEIEINKLLTIDGSNTAGSGVPVSVYGDGTQRIFHIPTTASGKTIKFNNMEINEGNATAAPGGGGILCEAGTLIVDNVSFYQNDATGTNADGGAIYAHSSSTCTITNSTFDENLSVNGEGGGMYALNTVVTLTGCTFSSNQAYNNGGGIYVTGTTTDTLSLINSTFSSNSALQGDGGAIYIASRTNMKFTDVCTNFAGGKGGGVYLSDGSSFNIQNCMLGNNSAGGSGADFNMAALSAVTDGGYNIVELYEGSYSWNATGDITGQQADLFGTGLATQTLADNGGPTQTLAIEAGSVAFEAGIADAAVTVDQRGIFRQDPPTIGAFDLISTVTSATGEIWMDRNLGASQVAISSTDAAAYGDLYQWGRFREGHQIRTSSVHSSQATTPVPNAGNDWDSKFITGTSDWLTPHNNTLWQGGANDNNPCPDGFRLPTEAEWEAERLSWGSNDAAGAYDSPLHLTVAGYRDRSDASLKKVGDNGYYWSSTVHNTQAKVMRIAGTGGGETHLYSDDRAFGLSVRCIKDD